MNNTIFILKDFNKAEACEKLAQAAKGKSLYERTKLYEKMLDNTDQYDTELWKEATYLASNLYYRTLDQWREFYRNKSASYLVRA